MLTLKAAKLSDDQVLTAAYEAAHTRPGHDGTTLRLDVVVDRHLGFGRVTARATLVPCIEGGTTEEALDKLADWAERLAIAIRHRGPASVLVPTFETPSSPAEAD